VTARGSAETDRNYLGRNSQAQFYADAAIRLFHRFITESRKDEWIIAWGSMSNASICGRFLCSKKVENTELRYENTELRYELANSNAYIFR